MCTYQIKGDARLPSRVGVEGHIYVQEKCGQKFSLLFKLFNGRCQMKNSLMALRPRQKSWLYIEKTYLLKRLRSKRYYLCQGCADAISERSRAVWQQAQWRLARFQWGNNSAIFVLCRSDVGVSQDSLKNFGGRSLTCVHMLKCKKSYSTTTRRRRWFSDVNAACSSWKAENGIDTVISR